ncbi:MAG: methylase involved in ubiquinone/menaquinone biosynthesis [Mycobacterium sp.]|jgi:SAM-dependent methyltransferase|nr:methylase involved in ubiquinone/menaquinone biosynthesis [Mycobacterium sp.]
MTMPSAQPVNHHADNRRFGGFTGLVAGLAMLVTGPGTARLAVEMSSMSGADLVVDIGCGPGSAVREAARMGTRVTGLDPAPVMLRLARTLTRDRPEISWALGAAEDLRLATGAATVVWSLASVHHWTDVGAGLAEVHRVLCPGGRFLTVERRVRPGARGLASHGWTDAQTESFATQCGAAGFADVRIRTLRRGRRTVKVVTAVRP